MKAKQVEQVYGIYFGKTDSNFTGPDGERQAGRIIGENESDKEIIANLVAADFLSQWNEYVVIKYGPSIHIHHKLNDKLGGIVLVLVYEEDLEPMNTTNTKSLKYQHAEMILRSNME